MFHKLYIEIRKTYEDRYVATGVTHGKYACLGKNTISNCIPFKYEACTKYYLDLVTIEDI